MNRAVVFCLLGLLLSSIIFANQEENFKRIAGNTFKGIATHYGRQEETMYGFTLDFGMGSKDSFSGEGTWSDINKEANEKNRGTFHYKVGDKFLIIELRDPYTGLRHASSATITVDFGPDFDTYKALNAQTSPVFRRLRKGREEVPVGLILPGNGYFKDLTRISLKEIIS